MIQHGPEMGTTGTITGVSRYLKEKDNNIQMESEDGNQNTSLKYLMEIYERFSKINGANIHI